MKSIKDIAREWCSAHSSKHCTEQCDGCWQVTNLMFGCEQHNMEEACIYGANYVLEVIESIMEDKELDVEETYDKIYATIKQLKK